MSPNQFYQKQPGSSNRRKRAMVIDSANRRDQQFNPDKQPEDYLRKNIKLFAVLIICMVSLLVLSIKYVEYQWGRRDRNILSRYSANQQDAPAVLSTNFTKETPSLPPESQLSVPPESADESLKAEIDTILRWGKVLEEAGELEGALDRYSEALKLDGENIKVMTLKGRLNIRMARYDEAAATLKKALELSGDDPDILNDLGVALTFNGQLNEAVDLYDSLLEMYPDYVPALFNQGYAYLQLQEYEKALVLLEQYISFKPDDTMALGVYAVLEVNNKNYEKAIELLDRAIELSPAWPMPYLDAATVCATLNQPDRALNYLERALEVAPPVEVYKRYQSPAFNDIRLDERGKAFEKIIAEKARKNINP